MEVKIEKRKRKKTVVDELQYFKRMVTEVYSSGLVSLVSDGFDLWKVCEEYLPKLKTEILARDGKVVIRPDSGDPVDIVCGEALYENGKPLYFETFKHPKDKGVIELLWETFGGTVNDKGYKVLDSHIGCIYGDSITLKRAEEICRRLEAKGFASSNIVFGVGSFTYQLNTRDTYGFAMKATYGEVEGVGRNIFKDPITDDGTKKSLKGLLCVKLDKNNNYIVKDQCTWEEENEGELKLVYANGEIVQKTDLESIRKRLNGNG